MLTTAQRERINERRASRGESLGETSRGLLADGLTLSAALERHPGLREDVERLAREASVELDEAIGTMLGFAVRESARRLERDRDAARRLAQGMAESGVPFDGASFGSGDVALD